MNAIMKKDDLILAMGVVAQMARDGVLEADSDDMEWEAQRQKTAVDMFEDLICNQHENIEEFFEGRGGAQSLKRDGEIPELDLDEIRDPANPKMDMMATTLELAAQQFREEDLDDATEIEIEEQVMLASHAVDLVGAFWERYGLELSEGYVDVALPEDFFDGDADLEP